MNDVINVSIWEPIKIRVMELIDEGNQSEIRGWVLSEILATITKEFDEQASRKAREFILVDVVNKPELVWRKDLREKSIKVLIPLGV